MSNNNNKLKKIPSYDLPLDITSNSAKDYAPALDMLINDNDFRALVDHRRRMYQARNRPGANLYAINKGVEADDRKIAFALLTVLQHDNMENGISKTISFQDLWDAVPKDDKHKQELKKMCAHSLDMVVFLADIIESKVRDIKDYLHQIFPEEDYDYEQFNGVTVALKQLSSLFGRTRDIGTTEERTLFAEYAQSLEDYFDKRMKTFIRKDDELRRKRAEKESQAKKSSVKKPSAKASSAKKTAAKKPKTSAPKKRP